jgi:propanol-preferring alcohol dehydrogenase
VVRSGNLVDRFAAGDRVGVPWLGSTDNTCHYCLTDRENLCDNARFTGYQIDGGYAEYAAANHRFCVPIPEGYPDLQAAPLLCAGLIGYRSLRMTGRAERLGLYGFGAAAHIIAQVALYQGRKVFAFTSAGDTQAQQFALELGAIWAVAKGGVVVCAGIHMSDIPSFPYEILWGERMVRSVANLTRRDSEEFLTLAPKVPVHTEVMSFPLEEANEALSALRAGEIQGAAVLVVDRGA